MNVFIYVDISNQFNSENQKLSKNLKSNKISTSPDVKRNVNTSLKCTSLIGVGGFRNRRVIFFNRAAIFDGIRYGECWNPCLHQKVICLSKREVSRAIQTLNTIERYIESNFGPCDHREKGFFGFSIPLLNDRILMKRLLKVKQDIEFKFNVKCSIGASSDPMIARLSCIMSSNEPRITSGPLLKSLISQIPLRVLGLPRKIEKILKDKSYYSSRFLRDLSIFELRKVLGNEHEKYALDLFRILRGIDPFDKQIKVPKKQLSQFLKFEEPITDPLTLYLSIENRWTEFRKFVCKYRVPISKLKFKLIYPEQEIQNIFILDNTKGCLPDRLSWRKELRNAIYNANIVKPILAVNLIAEYKQSIKSSSEPLSPGWIEKTQYNLISSIKTLNHLRSKLHNKNSVRKSSYDKLSWFRNEALRRNNIKSNYESI